MDDDRLWKPKAPGAFNEHDSEGPRDWRKAKAKKGAKQSDAATSDALDSSAAVEADILPDPEWVDIEEIPSVERYLLFTPPRAYQDDMLADKARWAHGVGHDVACAVSTVAARVVMPRLAALDEWRVHATSFFKRLCAHRRAMHDQQASAIEEMRARVEAIEARLAKMEEVMLEQKVPEQPSASSQLARGRGRSPTRTASLPRAVLEAQLSAIAARSPSPGPTALKALAEFSDRWVSSRTGSPTPREGR